MTKYLGQKDLKLAEQYGVFKTRDIRSHFPELEKFSTKWKQDLGRDVNFVAYPSSAVKRDRTEYLLVGNK